MKKGKPFSIGSARGEQKKRVNLCRYSGGQKIATMRFVEKGTEEKRLIERPWHLKVKSTFQAHCTTTKGKRCSTFNAPQKIETIRAFEQKCVSYREPET